MRYLTAKDVMQSPRDVKAPGQYQLVVTPRQGGGPPETYTTQSCSNRLVLLQSSVRTPRPRPSPMPPQPYSLFVHSYDICLNYQYIGPSAVEVGGGPINGAFGSYADIPQSSMDPLYNRVLDKLNEKVRGSLDLSVDIAEAGQTAKMLKVTDQITDLARTANRTFGPLKAAGNLWLQWTYGVRPLLSTVYGCAEESVRLVLNKTENFQSRASEYIVNPDITLDSIFGLLTYKSTGRLKRSVTLGANLRTDQFDLSRFTSLNPVSIAWELIPFSFVADWFYDVGSYLRNLETYLLYNNKFNSGYRTDLKVGSFSLERNVYFDGGFSLASGNYRVTEIRRSVLNSYPVPYLPSFEANLGSSRLLSAAALLSTLLKGKNIRSSDLNE